MLKAPSEGHCTAAVVCDQRQEEFHSPHRWCSECDAEKRLAVLREGHVPSSTEDGDHGP